MPRATNKQTISNTAEVFRFAGRLFKDPKPAKTGTGVLVNVSKEVSAQFPSGGASTVEGTINGQPFRAPLQPNPSGGHSLRVNKAMLKGAHANVGDTVQLIVLGPEPEPKLPADFITALNKSHEAKLLWKDLTTIGRLDWVRWITSTDTPETRARRITRTIDQLAEGKRRACCVNVYYYMLARIQEDTKSRRGRAQALEYPHAKS